MRIAHFSDIHVSVDPRRVGIGRLLGKRAVGWANLRVLGRYAALREAPAIVAALVRDLQEEAAPDWVVFSGDATSLSLEEEFAEAARLLEPLARSEAILGIPGNHDVYVRRAARERPFSRWFAAWERSDLPELACGASAPYPLVRLAGADVALIAVHASRPTPPWASSGKLGAPQLDALARALRDERLAGRRKVIVCHYGPRCADGRPDTFTHGLRDAEALLHIARDGGACLLLHGHMHRRYVLPAGDATPVPAVCVGSLTDARRERAYHLYELDKDGLRIRVRRYDAAADRFREAPDAAGAGALPLPGDATPRNFTFR